MKLNYVELELRRVNINSRAPNAQIWDFLVNSDPEIFTEGYCFDFSLLYNKYLVAYNNNHFIISHNFVGQEFRQHSADQLLCSASDTESLVCISCQ